MARTMVTMPMTASTATMKMVMGCRTVRIGYPTVTFTRRGWTFGRSDFLGACTHALVSGTVTVTLPVATAWNQ
jgi:hypothetical protein